MSVNQDSTASQTGQSQASIVRAAWAGMAFLAILLAIVIFGGAGSLRYWGGWAFWISFFAWVLGITVWFLQRDPALVASRTKVGVVAETRLSQKIAQGFAGLFFIAVLLAPALDWRFGWSDVPLWVQALGLLLVNAGMAGVMWVMNVNSYASSTIQVAEGQRVIENGPYAWVRHPMYSSALVMLFGAPLLMGSWWGLIFAALLGVAIAARLLDEERALQQELPGYAAYMQRTRSRLIPGLW